MAEQKCAPDCAQKKNNPRLGTVGGSAVLEGVMMKGKTHYAVAVRSEAGDLRVMRRAYTSVRKKHKWLNIPILRGVVSFVESMALSMKTLNFSALIYSAAPTEEGEEEKPLSSVALGVLMTVASVLAVLLALLLFQWAPAKLTSLLAAVSAKHLSYAPHRVVLNLVEGAMKLLLLLGYLLAVSAMKDIRRTFEFHGAEHKSIFCYEAGEALTVENVKKYRRFHPRCGTSFLFVMIFIGVLVSCLPFVPWENTVARVGFKLLLLPVVMGLGFEFLMVAGKHPNAVTRILSAPGLWVQRITTREPDDAQIEAAIVSLQCALPDEFGMGVPENATLVGEDGKPIEADVTESTESTEETQA